MPHTAERLESDLVKRLVEHLKGLGHVVSRLRIVPNGERMPIFADILDETADLLLEAKGSVTRENVRMAVGQLADYGRFRPAARRAILLPERPRADLLSFASSQRVDVVWPANPIWASAGVTLPWLQPA
jgi:hypothetical protein